MQHVDMATVKGARASDRKSLAILAYDNATADPAGANWRAVADILRLAIPATKAKAAEIAADSRFAAWADYEIKGSGKNRDKAPVLIVTLAGGEIVRAPAYSNPGKPLNIGRGLRIAIAFYQCRIARRLGFFAADSSIVAVPEFVSIICENTGAEYDAADCNARTADLRAGSFDVAAATADAANLPEEERLRHVVQAFKVARYDASHSEPQAEYTDADREILAHWADARPNAGDAIRDAAGEVWLTAGAAARLGWAVMTFWPDLADSELPGDVVAPAEIAPPLPVTPAEIVAAPVAAEIPVAVSSPVAPSFKVAPRFLGSSRMGRIGPPLPVAPSCILRVAA